MKNYIETAKNYITTHEKLLIVIASSLLGVIIIAFLVAVLVYNIKPNIVYQPADACKLFTPSEAIDLLGDKIIDINTDKPAITDNIAVSQCSYSDQNPDRSALRVAAVSIQSGINDLGVAQNKAGFEQSKPTTNIQDVTNIGDSAYYDQTLGQLDVLKAHQWYKFSYGIGSTPEANTLDDALILAHKVIN